MQPDLKNTSVLQPGTAADTDGAALPGGSREEIRTTITQGVAACVVTIPPERTPSQITQEPLYRPNIPLTHLIISIIQQTQPVVGGQGMATDPLLEAVQRLADHGILPARDGLIAPSRDSSSSRGNPVSWVRAVPGGAPSRGTAESFSDTAQARMPRAERVPQGGGATHAHGESKQDQLSEEKIREILERALAAFHERRGDGVPSSERKPSAAASPERAGLDRNTEGRVELRPKEPTDSILLTPSVRDALNDPRNETARLMQQLLSGESQQGRHHAAPIPGVANTDRFARQPMEPTPVSVRAGISEGLSQIRDALQTTIERSSPRPPTFSDKAHALSAQTTKPGDFTHLEPVRYHQTPTVTIQGEDRAAARTSTRTTDALMSPICSEGLALSLSSPGALRPAGHPSSDRAVAHLDTANSLLDAIARAAEKALSIQTLRKLDQAVETAVISAAAAVALGVIGGEIILKEILALGKDVLDRLRSRTDQPKSQDEELQEVRDLVRELEKICSDRDVETIDQPAGFVADITGTIRHHDTDIPIEGIEVDGGSLGITRTNSQGEFIFKNVPLETGYVVYARGAGYSFFPNPAQGTVSAITNLSIVARRG